MVRKNNYRPLTDEQVKTLAAQGCSSTDWSAVQVAEGFLTERVCNAHFAGEVRLGANDGTITSAKGTAAARLEKPCGVYDVRLYDCTLGDGVRVARVGIHLANYDVGDGACIENIGMMETRPGATFGNGARIEALNESGGREIVLFDKLDSQFAHLLCLHRHRAALIEKLEQIARSEAEKVKSGRGTVGPSALIRNARKIVDVRIGRRAVVDGAASLINGTVLSSEDAPTTVGADVQADNFIVAEGSKVDGGAMLSSSFVGQGCLIDKQFSSEGSVFFANCEGFHGEACSVFAGPHTVTHHKSTLLIAGMFSFFNAGSGTNQSNHLYKLGPVHEGKLERGCKTGSFSYMMWPCRVGPFSVVLGKHTRAFDTADFPFSYIDASPKGRCQMTPGFNLTTVGTVRDGDKWPNRDRRKGADRRDRICFDIFSPLSVGRMLAGSARMKELQDSTDRAVDTVSINGAEVKRVLLRTGQKFYRSAIQMYLLEKVVARVEAALAAGAETAAEALEVSPESLFSETWVDVGGQMMPAGRVDELCRAVESGSIGDLDALNGLLDRILAAYAEDEWAWVRWACQQALAMDLGRMKADDLSQLADDLAKAREKFLNLILLDAGKEFAGVSRTGFGQDGTSENATAEFAAVRGEFETNKFVKQVKDEIAALADRVERFKQAIKGK